MFSMEPPPALFTRRLRWRWDDLVAADGHRLLAVFTTAVTAVNDPAEQHLFRETFSGDATDTRVADHFAPALRSAANDIASKHTIDDLLHDGTHEKISAAMLAAARAVAFACGLDVLPPTRLELSSPTLEKLRLDQMQQTLHQKQTDAAIEQFRRAGELLQQFQSLRESSPNISAEDVLNRVGPADQAAMLKLLQMAAAKEQPTAAVLVVAGSELLRIDPQSPTTRIDRIATPEALGPLRSVSPGPLLGGRSGVLRIDPAQPRSATLYTTATGDSPFGFSRAVQAAGSIWACHRDVGLVCWRNESPQSCARTIAPAELGGAGPRLLCDDGRRLLFAVGPRVMQLDAGEVRPAIDLPADPVAILPTEHRVLIVLPSGAVHVLDRDTLQLQSTTRSSGPVTAAALLPWLGSDRLLLATHDGPVLCVSLDDSLVTRYASPHVGLTTITAAADLVAAVSADRRRLILWHAWDGTRPEADIHLASQTKHRIADIALA